jgi:hypothetical protein
MSGVKAAVLGIIVAESMPGIVVMTLLPITESYPKCQQQNMTTRKKK